MNGLRRALACIALYVTSAGAVADGPVLWEVAGRDNAVYLFGSIHLLRAGEFAIDGALAQAYDDAAAIYMEIDLDDLSPLDMAAAVSGRAVDPEGRTLDELMGPDAAEAHALAERAGIELGLLGQVEPWFAGLTVVSLMLAREGYGGESGVDQVVQARAVAEGKEILGLEQLDDQLAVLDGLEPAKQREFLLKSLRDAERLPQAVGALLAAWRSGDEAALARELAFEFEDEPGLYRELIVDRNRRWAEQIESLLDDDRDYLVIVGALHLVGEDGLPAMLQARGVPVARR